MRLHGGYYRKDAYGRKVLNTGELKKTTTTTTTATPEATVVARKRKAEQGDKEEESSPKEKLVALGELTQPDTSQLLADLERKGIQATSLASSRQGAAASASNVAPHSVALGASGQPRRTHSCSSIPLLPLAQSVSDTSSSSSSSPSSSSTSSVSVLCLSTAPQNATAAKVAVAPESPLLRVDDFLRPPSP